MSDLFSRYSTPSPPPQLRARVLAAASRGRSTPAVVRTLDTLWSSRLWWSVWSGSMIVLAVLAGGPRQDTGWSEQAAESWKRHRVGVAAALAGDEPARTSDQASTPGGAA